jgi:hypothetical protein
MTDSASAIATGPIVEALHPIISAVVAATVGVAVTFGVALLKRWTGVTLQSAYVDSLRQAAQTEAGVLVAEAADNLSSRSITVTSPAIAAAAARIATAMPDAVRAVGKTPEDLSRLVAGEVGKLQAHSTAISVPTSPSRTRSP